MTNYNYQDIAEEFINNSFVPYFNNRFTGFYYTFLSHTILKVVCGKVNYGDVAGIEEVKQSLESYRMSNFTFAKDSCIVAMPNTNCVGADGTFPLDSINIMLKGNINVYEDGREVSKHVIISLRIKDTNNNGKYYLENMLFNFSEKSKQIYQPYYPRHWISGYNW